MKKLLRIDADTYMELSYEEVLEKYKNFLYKTALDFSLKMGVEFEDVHQSCKIDAWLAYDRYDVSRGVGFGHLLKTMVINKLIKTKRDLNNSKRRIMFFTESYNQLINTPDRNDIEMVETFSDDIDYADMCVDNVCLRDALNKLKDRDKDIILGYYINDIPQIVLAKKYGITQVQVSRILKKIAKEIRKEVV